MVHKPEIYVSTDVEADGPIPGENSMLSFGSAAYLADKRLVSTFTANLETLPGAVANAKTMNWWRGQPEAWKACRENLQPPKKAMNDYLGWLKGLPGTPVFVGYPSAYDFMFVYWYLIHFAGESPFSHSALDIKTLAMVLLKTNYRKATKKNMPKEWFDPLPHSHQALDTAIEQGALFCNMLAEVKWRVDWPFLSSQNDKSVKHLKNLKHLTDEDLPDNIIHQISNIAKIMN